MLIHPCSVKGTITDMADLFLNFKCTMLVTLSFSHVDDIDLFAGGMSEDHVPGGVIGPTFACIIGIQFRNLRVGDRFWHERNDTLVGFTLGKYIQIFMK